MSDVLSDPLSMLEESFSLEIPCGGNETPVKRRCPDNAAAVMFNPHSVNCCERSSHWKCMRCLTEWLQGKSKRTDAICDCGLAKPVYDWYIPL